MSTRRNEELQRRYRRYVWGGLVLSVLLHAALFVAFRGDRAPAPPAAAAGPRAGGERAAAADARAGGMRVLDVRPSTTRPTPEIITIPRLDPIPDPDVSVPDPETPEVEPVEFEEDIVGVLGEAVGSEAEAGREDGAGAGAGGTAAEGRRRLIPPRPRGMIMPPGDRPDEVRGTEVEVWIFVNRRGKVVSDSTRLRPPTGHDGYDARLREHAARWVFDAARKGGRPVGAWFQYIVTL